MENEEVVTPYTVLKWPFQALKFVGFDMLRSLDTRQKTRKEKLVQAAKLIYFGFVYANIFVCHILQTILLFKKIDDLNASVSLLLNMVNTTMLLWKIFSVCYRRKEILETLEKLNETKLNLLREKVKNKVLKTLKAFKTFETAQLFLTSATIFSFGLVPVFNYLVTGAWFSMLPWNFWMPFDRFSRRYYNFMYIWTDWMFYHVALLYFAVDMIILGMIVMVSVQFIILEHECDEAVDGSGDLSVIIRKHNDLIKMVHKLNHLFSSSLMLNFFGSSILLCVSAFLLALSNNPLNLIEHGFLLLLMLCQIFLLCYLGNLLETSSLKLCRSIYATKWYETADKRALHGIKMMLNQAQTPCQIKAWKFTALNYETFMKVLNATYSYYMLLRSRALDET